MALREVVLVGRSKVLDAHGETVDGIDILGVELKDFLVNLRL